MIDRLVRSADFERVLRTRSWASSPHFALHHVADRPSASARSASPAPNDAPASPGPVASGSVWLGAVVPKRHARRAVTRSLLKRQIKAVVAGQSTDLAGGLWVVRLRAPFDRERFASAASDALRGAARAELEQLLASALRRVGTR